MIANCDQCKYWDGHENDPFTGLGNCFRFPPTLIVIGRKTAQFPITSNDDGCGEFKERKD